MLTTGRFLTEYLTENS